MTDSVEERLTKIEKQLEEIHWELIGKYPHIKLTPRKPAKYRR